MRCVYNVYPSARRAHTHRSVNPPDFSARDFHPLLGPGQRAKGGVVKIESSDFFSVVSYNNCALLPSLCTPLTKIRFVISFRRVSFHYARTQARSILYLSVNSRMCAFRVLNFWLGGFEIRLLNFVGSLVWIGGSNVRACDRVDVWELVFLFRLKTICKFFFSG